MHFLPVSMGELIPSLVRWRLLSSDMDRLCHGVSIPCCGLGASNWTTITNRTFCAMWGSLLGDLQGTYLFANTPGLFANTRNIFLKKHMFFLEKQLVPPSKVAVL